MPQKGYRQTPEHRAKIAASKIGQTRARHLVAMSPAEREDYRVLHTKGRYSRNAALRAIGRADLIPVRADG